jgi:outer membrane protein TolC
MEGFLQAWDWPVEPLTPLPEVSAEPLDWRASLERAVQHRPELWQRRFDVDIAEVRLSQARSERLPQLDLQLSSSGIGFDADPEEAFDTAIGWDFPDSTAALIFSMPLLNRTARYAERAARANVRSARLVYDRTELDVLAEVRAAVRAVLFSGESVEAAIKSRDLAQRQLEAEETRQSVGLSTTFQVLEFQEDLAFALSTEVRARATHAKALALLEHAEGRLGQSLVGAAAEAPEPGADER